MSLASTLQGIKDILLSEHLSEKVEIFSIDTQQSCNDGVIVIVTGFLIGDSEKKRSFIQTFFLAKHETGYFVLNDIFRFGIGETLDIVADTEVPEIDVATPLIEEENHGSLIDSCSLYQFFNFKIIIYIYICSIYSTISRVVRVPNWYEMHMWLHC